jgi:spermidine synthase
MFSDLWIEENFEDYLGLRLKVEKTLFSGKSDFQQIDVVETRGHGRVLLNDGLIMVSERDEFAYHDMIAHVPLFTHPDPKRVLVIGGGDGGTAREVIRHLGVETCVMVEIDAMVVDACKEHIPQTSSALSDPRIELIIDDGVAYMANAAKNDVKFDVIIVDSTDPIGPATPLFGEGFYRDVFASLSDDGIVVSQGESPWYNKDVQKSLLGVLNNVFDNVWLYNFSNLTYPGGLWSFTFASKRYHPVTDFSPARVSKSGLDFDYYNAGVHLGSFSLPNFVKHDIADLIQNT